MLLFNLIIFAVFPVVFVLAGKFGIDWLKIIPGLSLIYFLPGHNLAGLIFKNRKLDWFIRLPLDILGSIAILSIGYLVLKSKLDFEQLPITIFIYSVNLLIFLIAYIFDYRKRAKNSKPLLERIKKFWMNNRFTLIIFSVPFVMFAVRLILNHYIFDIDSLVYYDAYRTILNVGSDTTMLFKGREIFPFLMMSSNYVAGLDYILFFKFFTPLIFYFSSSILFALFEKPKNKMVCLSYLLILVSPMLIIMNESIRPETIIIFLTLPILVMTYLALKNNDFLFAFIAVFFSLVAARSHESGSVLMFIAMLALLIMLLMNFKSIWRVIAAKPFVNIVIALPYIFIIYHFREFFIGFLANRMLSRLIGLLQMGWAQHTQTWWFLSNAVTNTGAELSWPGISAVYYYLYDGIFLLIFALIVFISYQAMRKKPSKKIYWLALIPVLAYFLVQFSYAEIIPRLGAILYPNRAWPHIMLVLVPISIILVCAIYSNTISIRLRSIFSIIFILTLLSGLVGTTVGSTFMGAMVSPSETGAIEAVKSLPADSVVVSSQRNHNLVRIYAKKEFVSLQDSSLRQNGYKQENFDQTVRSEAGDASLQEEMVRILDPIGLVEKREAIIYENGKVLSVSPIEDPKNFSEYDDKLRILRYLDNEKYRMVDMLLTDAKNQQDKQLYFLYSFSKLDHGILKTRSWWRASADANDYDFFKNYSDQNKIVAKDDNFILIKIDR